MTNKMPPRLPLRVHHPKTADGFTVCGRLVTDAKLNSTEIGKLTCPMCLDMLTGYVNGRPIRPRGCPECGRPDGFGHTHACPFVR